MRGHGLRALVLLLVAMGLEHLAYYGSRAVLSLHLGDQGMSPESITTTMTMLQGVSLVGMLGGGAAALAFGPRATAALGLVVSAAGQLAMAAGASLTLGTAAVTLGVAMFAPCPLAAGAAVLAWNEEGPAPPGPHRFAAVAVFAMAAYGTANIAGFLAPLVASVLRALSWARVYACCGALMLVAAALAGGAVGLGFLDRRDAREAGDAGPYRTAPRAGTGTAPAATALRGVALLLVPAMVCSAGAAVLWSPYKLIGVGAETWLFAVHPLAVVGASVFVFAALLAVALQRWSLPPLFLYAGGLLVFALGLVPVAFAGSTSREVYAVGAVITGIGEAPTFVVPIAYAAIAIRGRAATLVVAVWMVLTQLASAWGNANTFVNGQETPLLWLCAALTLAAGMALVVHARRLQQTFFELPQGSARGGE